MSERQNFSFLFQLTASGFRWKLNDFCPVSWIIFETKNMIFSLMSTGESLHFKFFSTQMFFFTVKVYQMKNLTAKNTKNAFFAVYWAYVGQPDNHIGWASIDPTHPRTNWWNIGKNCSAFGGHWNTQFFQDGHFDFLLHSYF